MSHGRRERHHIGMGRDRDSKRLEELFSHHEQELGRFVAQLVHSRQLADDLVQETFLAAWRSRADLEHVRDPRAWLYGIARNRVLMYLRGWRRAIAAYERFVERQVPVPPEEADAYAVRDLMARTLSPEERAVIVLFHLHGFRADEIAAISGRSPDAVRKQLERARTKLARAHTSDPLEMG
jgi:RNA polymerase sigma-70 factor, ECF subfamily